MKDKTIKFRVSTKQFDAIREKGGDNLSAWIVSKLLPFDELVNPVIKSVNETIKASVVHDPKSFSIDKDTKVKCVSCYSHDTKPYERRGNTFYLCDLHKP